MAQRALAGPGHLMQVQDGHAAIQIVRRLSRCRQPRCIPMREDTRTASLAASALCVASHLTSTPAVPAVRPLHRIEHAPRPVGLRYVRHVLREGLARCTRTLRNSSTHAGISSNLRPWFFSSSTADRHRHRLQCGRSRVSSRALHPNSSDTGVKQKPGEPVHHLACNEIDHNDAGS